jgi:hypothetical protein
VLPETRVGEPPRLFLFRGSNIRVDTTLCQGSDQRGLNAVEMPELFIAAALAIFVGLQALVFTG